MRSVRYRKLMEAVRAIHSSANTFSYSISSDSVCDCKI